MSQFTISGGAKTAWHNKGRTAALKKLQPSPPAAKKEADWYMEGFRTGKAELKSKGEQT